MRKWVPWNSSIAAFTPCTCVWLHSGWLLSVNGRWLISCMNLSTPRCFCPETCRVISWISDVFLVDVAVRAQNRRSHVSCCQWRTRRWAGEDTAAPSPKSVKANLFNVFKTSENVYRPRSRGDNTFGSVRVCACVCPSFCLWALSCLNRLTIWVDLDLG